ncbi:MAG: ABC transporter permease [Candidatus Heimdallarchaeota archaeon]|nr:ABC transporter permease [Candidatus Heimdallarchaeota archaeon]MCK5049649.1 ABC transporter permease [Candidatus Heimdallarchaeota archaeon]
MSYKKQIFTLIKQELRQAFRTKNIYLVILVMPLFLWGLQSGIMYFTSETIDSGYEGKDLYFLNTDEGNTTTNLGEEINQVLSLLTTMNESQMYKVNVIDLSSILYHDINSDGIYDLIKENDYSPLVFIPNNFTSLYSSFNVSDGEVLIPEVSVYYLPADNYFGMAIKNTIDGIVYAPPFTMVSYEKVTSTKIEMVTFEGEENAESMIGFITFLSVMLALIAPASYVTASFAGEREKKTMESLLVLPMKRIDILIGKLIAGSFLAVLFSAVNLIGVAFFSFTVNSSTVLSDDAGFELSPAIYLMIFVVMLFTSFAALGLGISISSLMSDQKTAETTYMLTMILPINIVGLIVLLQGVPETLSWLYLIPWTHSMAVMNKGVFPKTYANSSLTGSVTLDIVFHLGVLLIFVIISMVVASKIFDREGVVSN